MPIVVQKFGGTSVNTAEKRARVLDLIIKAKQSGNDVVVVVSAMGRKGEPYATDTFLGLLEEVGPGASLRTKDLLASCGEVISACVVAHALEQRGYQSLAMTGFQAGIKTSEGFTNADILDINPQKIHSALKSGFIVVVAGFQGITENLDVTTLGRGGSDTTAIALGGALGATMVEIYTDVPGVAFSDPRLLPEAPYLSCIDFEPLYIMSCAGAKVVHHRAIKTAVLYKMPFMVKSTFSDEEGTLVGRKGENFGGLYGIAAMKGVCFLQAADSDEHRFWRNLCLDDLFYKKEAGGVSLVALNDKINAAAVNGNYACREEGELVTTVWEPGSGITADTILTVMRGMRIKPRAFFNLPLGGAWVVPTGSSQEIVQSIYAALVKCQEKKAI